MRDEPVEAWWQPLSSAPEWHERREDTDWFLAAIYPATVGTRLMSSAFTVRTSIGEKMPHFYFHVIDGGERLEDSEGLELADEEAAKSMAVQTAREIIAELIRNGEAVDGQIFEVADTAGRVIMRLPFKSAIPN